MSQENVERYRRLMDAFNRRDWDALVSMADEQVEVESRLIAIEARYRGHDGLRRWWDNFLAAFPDYTAEVLEVRDLGDATLSRVRGFAHGAESTVPVVDPFWLAMRWRDGKCVGWHNCETEAEAFKAVGLAE